MSYVTTQKGMYYGENLKQTAYRHLATAILISTVVIFLILYIENPPVGIYFIGMGLETLIIFGLFFSAIFRIQFSERTALIILNIFAIASSITLGYLVKFVMLYSDPMIVYLTFGISGVVVFGIYAYTSINKPDVSGMRKKVMIFALLFIIFSFFGMIFFSGAQFSTFTLIMSGLGALLFALFMYMDFARLERQEFSSPAMMALMLFYDIIFFVKYLLLFLMSASRR